MRVFVFDRETILFRVGFYFTFLCGLLFRPRTEGVVSRAELIEMLVRRDAVCTPSHRSYKVISVKFAERPAR